MDSGAIVLFASGSGLGTVLVHLSGMFWCLSYEEEGEEVNEHVILHVWSRHSIQHVLSYYT